MGECSRETRRVFLKLLQEEQIPKEILAWFRTCDSVEEQEEWEHMHKGQEMRESMVGYER